MPEIRNEVSKLNIRGQLNLIYAMMKLLASILNMVQDNKVARDESPKITFLSLPKEFVIVSMSEFDRIKYYDGMVYYMDVPIPVLSKMNELGKLFTK